MKLRVLILPLVFVLFSCRIGMGQGGNLVNNPGFEYHTICPDNTSQIEYAAPWFQPLFRSTSDFFDTCGHSLEMNSVFAIQMPRTGGGMAAVYYYNPYGEYREYLETELKTPLKTGRCYYAEYYVNLNNYSNWATDAVEMYFSDTIVANLYDTIIGTDTLWTIMRLDFIPQVRNPVGRIVDDTAGWTKISGTFTANGGERFLLIGNFERNEDCNYSVLNGGEMMAYYFIDDVLVMECPDTVVPPEVHNTVFIPNIFSPNKDGQNDDFRVYGKNITQINFTVYNRWGNEVFRTQDLNTGWDGRYKNKDCSSGVYFYVAEVTFADGSSVVKKGNVTLVR